MRLPLIITLIASPLLLAINPASAQNSPAGAKPASDAKVWGALVYAADPAETDLPDGVATNAVAFDDISTRLGKVFPDKKFILLGEHTQDIFREYESWVVPSKHLFAKIDSKGRDPEDRLLLHLQFWHDEDVIAKADAVLEAGSPLFIGGPKWRNGRLILVVLLAGDKKDS
ncbi:MAG: hypothetical protein AAF591_17600 [Verrucomicrobiota bacterium]